jgi:hypothetical protein
MESGSDSSSQDTGSQDTGSPEDTGSQDTGSQASDSGTDSGLDGGVESGPPGPPHVVFVTSDAFTGDIVGAANALVSDGGAPAPDGGSYGAADWQAAGDALCEHAAKRGGLPAGTYWSLLSGHNGSTAQVSAFTRMSDSDGPWALVDGTPVAATVFNLSKGNLWASIDRTESGAVRTFQPGDPGNALAWGSGVNTVDCNGWTAATTPDGGPVMGVAGSYRLIWQYYFNNVGGLTCTQALPLYCAQVGHGAGPLVKRSVPTGGKLAARSPW